MYLRLLILCLLLYIETKRVYSSPGQGIATDHNDLVVELQNLGKIRGHILKSSEGNNFYAFQDIPYAEPPVGENRFKVSKPHGPWKEILNVTSNDKICPQQFLVNTSHLLPDARENEDCLVLNVYTPVKPSSNSSLPVLFWIHGGSFVHGSGAMTQHDPKFLIDFDIVIVTINYRLGVLGFLTTLDDNIPGNLGLKDQLLSLKWTHKHINKFGGDPKQITVGGQSVGSMSAGFHLLSKSARGLINGIIQQSGSPLSGVFYPTNDRQRAFDFGKSLNSSFTSTKSSDLLRLLRQASYIDIMNVQKQFRPERSIGFMNTLTFKPVLEDNFNDDAFVTKPMHGAVMDGHFNRVPVLMGLTSEESLAFLPEITEEVIKKRAKLLDENPKNLSPNFLNIAEEDKAKIGKYIQMSYNYSSFIEERSALIKYTSDHIFTRSVIRQAESASRYVPVYLYQFSWLPDGNDNIGVPHVADLWYLWGKPSRGKHNKNLRKPMLKWITNFIKYQNPTPFLDEELQNVIWTTVQPNDVKYLDINNQFTLKENPRNYYNMKYTLDLYIHPPYISY